MTSTQLILLALTCINENREPSHTEQSRIYVFYKTEIDDKAISINEFILLLSNSSLYCQIEQPKRAPVIELIESYVSSSADKSHARKQNNHAQSRKSNSVSKRFPQGYEYSKEDQMSSSASISAFLASSSACLSASSFANRSASACLRLQMEFTGISTRMSIQRDSGTSHGSQFSK